MDKFLIEGNQPLNGEIKISGSKNAALPVMAAAILTEGETILDNVPRVWDIRTMSFVLRTLGVRVEELNGRLKIIPPKLLHYEAPYELVKTMRASVLVMGPLLAKVKRARVSFPGGCAIGVRPIDLHLKGLAKMGADIAIKDGYVEGYAKTLVGTRICFKNPSVGATENIMMAAVLARGKTYIENAAREPEIVDLANFLNQAGAKIKNAGSKTIEITGVDRLRGIHYKIIPDRIETGTFLIACAATGGKLTVKDTEPENVRSLIDKLQKMGVKISTGDNTITVERKSRLRGVDITTSPYPGFPTDLQPQIMSLLCTCAGSSVVRERIFENRFTHVGELQRMGANIEVQGNRALIKGVHTLNGTSVMASDIRCGAALVIAGLSARGETKISRVYHIDRGYEKIEEKLSAVGARIKRIK